MADEVLNTPAVEPTPAPVVETPVAPSAPVVETVIAPEAPVTPEVTPAVEAAPEPVIEKKEDTLLGEGADIKAAEEVKPSEEVKVEEAKAEETEQKVEGGQSEEPAPPPSYEAFKVPEDVQLSPERITEFTKLLSDLEVTGKADHAAMQEFGQKAIEFHVNEQKALVETIQKTQLETWEKTVIGWKDDFLKDPEIGGNRFQTTLDSANKFIKTHGGTAEQQKEFRNLLNTSGLGNHPTMIRILAQAGSAMSEGKPLAASTPVSAPKSKTATMYGPKE